VSNVVKCKVGDTAKRIRWRVFEDEALSTPMDLTGKTVRLIAGTRASDGTVTVLFNAVATQEDQTSPDTIGYAYYDVAAGDVDAEGTFDVEVKVYDGGGKPLSIPDQGFFQFVVSKGLA
jgi:hypothetical protein